MSRLRSIAWLLCCVSLAARAQSGSFKVEGLGAPREVEFTARVDGSVQRFVELLPEGYASNQPVALMVFLHGHGSDRWQITKGAQWKEIQAVCDAAGRHRVILVSPDYRASTSWMGPLAEADVVQVIEEQKARRRISRVIVAGGSMGGTAALIFTALHPDLVQGVVSMNGTANMMEYAGFQDAVAKAYGGIKRDKPEEYRKRSPELVPEKFKGIAVALTVGGLDTVVPPESVWRLGRKLAERDAANVLLLDRPNVGHSTTYEDALQALTFVLDRAGVEGNTGRTAEANLP